MRNILLIIAFISVVGMGCNANGKTSETVTDEVANNVEPKQEKEKEEPAVAPEPETYYHYSDYQITLSKEEWEVNVAYSDTGIDKIGASIHFNVKHWDSPSLEKAISKYSAESRREDIVIGDYTWKVFAATDDYYKLCCYVYNPDKKMVLRVGTDDISDVKDQNLLAVLEGIRFGE